MRDSYWIVLICGFIAGIIMRSFFVVSLSFVATLGFVGLLVLFLSFVLRDKKIALYAALLFMSCAGGIYRFHFSDKPLWQSPLFSYQHMPHAFHGIVTSNPDVRETATQFEFTISSVDSHELDSSETILVKIDPLLHISYGDEITGEGIAELPQSFENDLGKTFDYVSYLKKDGIVFILDHPKVEITGHDAPSVVKEKLFAFQNHVIAALHRELTEPESSFMAGIILGTKSALGKDVRDQFIRTGTIHVVALSGYNVTILALFIMALFRRFLSTRPATVAGIISIMLFVIMTGAGSTVVRAAIMAIIVLLARILGREADIGRALVTAGFLMLMWNPWILVFDVSFQLSFLATIGLVYLTPKVKPWVSFVTEKFELREIIASTIATNIFVLPFIIYQMGIFSLVALPANLLILPLMPLTMLAGASVIFVHFIYALLAIPFSYLTYIILHYELWVTKFFSHLPFAALEIAHFPLSLAIVIYGFLIYWMFKRNKEIIKGSP